MAANILFVTGGCKSGKSGYALKQADRLAPQEKTAETAPDTIIGKTTDHPTDRTIKTTRKIFIATCQALDDEISERIEKHKKERGPEWTTVEASVKLAEAIADHASQTDIVVADCLTLWVNNLLMEEMDDDAIQEQIRLLLTSLSASRARIIIVSNEVGAGIVPLNSMARYFRDVAGMLNQAVAKIADEVVWMVSGIPVKIK
jgi:adenosylcobinamide kinase / adenosylcobinamide-phosphate guanylyltransferase